MDDNDLEAPIFRANKKRKLNLRQRQRSPTPPPSVHSPEGEQRLLDNSRDKLPPIPIDDSLNLTSSATAKKALPRKRTTGIEFSGTQAPHPISHDDIPSVPASRTAAHDPSELTTLSSRFAPSTGITSRRIDEERYLNAYIDSHLKPSSSAVLSTDVVAQVDTENSDDVPSSGTIGHATQSGSKQPALLGRIQEIELPPPRSQHDGDTGNVSADGSSTHFHSEKPKKPKLPPKVRVNRFGKILPPRRRRRYERTEDDVQRDRMVEEMLSSFEVRPALDRTMTQDAVQGGEEGDEEFAERFKREFLENAALASGGRRTISGGSMSGSAVGGKKDAGSSSASTGPRTGGSRNYRVQGH